MDCMELFSLFRGRWMEACDVIGNSGDKNVVFDAMGASGGAFIVQARKIESLTDEV